VVDHRVVISATATRVPVLDGHTESVSVALADAPPMDALAEAFRTFSGRPQRDGLPSAPARPIDVLDRADRPQPRLDADAGGGMTVSVGRLRACPVFHAKFVALGHNTVRGAAGAAILNAELLAHDGWLGEGVTPW